MKALKHMDYVCAPFSAMSGIGIQQIFLELNN